MKFFSASLVNRFGFLWMLASLLLGCDPVEDVLPALRISELENYVGNGKLFSSENDLLDRWQTGGDLLGFYNNSPPIKKFIGEASRQIAYKAFVTPSPTPLGAILILPGRTEPIIKYAEVAYDLTREGYHVVVLSHRGQGESDRLSADKFLGHIDNVDYYAKDVAKFVLQIYPQIWSELSLSKPDKLFLLTHSMGGAVAALAMAEAGVQSKIKAAVLIAPMFEINLGAFPPAVATTFANTIRSTLSHAESFAAEPKEFKSNPDFRSKDENGVTGSKSRFDWKNQLFINDPEIRLGGASYGWVGGWLARQSPIAVDAKQISVPFVIFRAGQDSIVLPGGQEKVCRASPVCELVNKGFESAQHEILQETDDIRNRAMHRILKFFSLY